MSEDLSSSSGASKSHEPMDSTSPKDLPSAASSRQAQEPSASNSNEAEVPSASNSNQAQVPSASNSSQAQVPSASDSNQAQVPSASHSSQAQVPSTSHLSQAQVPSASPSNVEPTASSSSQTPSASTSSQVHSTPSTSSSSQVPTNLTLNLLPSTSTSDNQGTKDKSIDPLKLKILCFHGYMQDAKKFKEKLGAFRKLVSKYAYVAFVAAPHIVALDPTVPPSNQGDRGNNNAGNPDSSNRSWWFNAEDNTFSGKILGGPAIGFQETLETVKKAVADYGPFDGFMGFSQGACLVGILAAMQQKKLLQYRFKFAILVSGFLSGSLVHRGFYDELIDIPSLHVYGEGDSTIPKEMSESLINKFRLPVVIEHPGGHYVPTAGPVREAYEDFLADMYQQRLIDRQEAERTAA